MLRPIFCHSSIRLLAILSTLFLVNCNETDLNSDGTNDTAFTSSIENQATDVSPSASFSFSFAHKVDSDSVNSESLFLVLTPSSNASVNLLTSQSSSYEDICDATQALTSTIACNSETECTLTPASSLDYSTDYTLCLSHGIAFQNRTFGYLTDTFIQFTTSAQPRYSVGGVVTGLDGTVVLQNNNGDDLNVTASGNFTFTTTLASGSDYAVTVLTNPTAQACTVSHASGTIDAENVDSVEVACTSTAPTLLSLSPTSGTTTGGTTVTLSGTNLTGTTGVTFDGTSATINSTSATSVSCTTPAHGAGTVDVVVTTPIASATLSSSYTYVIPAPNLSSLDVSSGSINGGTVVTLSGTNFMGATGVTFDGSTASLVSTSATSVTCIAPAHGAGAVDVSITTPGGTSTLSSGYTYFDPSVKIIPFNTATGIWRASDNTLWGVGDADSNGFGDDLTDPITDWTQVASDVVKAWGFYSTLIIQDSNGDLFSAGYNDFGQLSTGSTIVYTDPPATTFLDVIVTGEADSSVTEIFVGLYTTYALVGESNDLFASGRNDSGQAGVGSGSNAITQFTDTGLSNIESVAMGSSHVLALAADGTVYGAGNNSFGQLSSAIGASTNTFEAMTIPATGGDVVKIAAGNGFTLVLKEGGQLYGIGQDANGALGGGGNTVNWILIDSGVENVWAAYQSSFYQVTDGTLYGVGDNWAGELGLADIGSITDITEIPFDTTVDDMYPGLFTNFIVDTDGDLFGAGENENNKLGTGLNTDPLTEFTSLSF